jgi:hypothetical protein
VYVYPKGTQPTPGRTAAIAHVGHEVRYWFAAQMGGPAPKFYSAGDGFPTVVSIEANLAAQALSTGDIVKDSLAGWQSAGLLPADALPIVWIEGRQALRACAVSHVDGVRYISVAMGICGIYPTGQDVLPYGATYVLAHEILHELGAMSDNAPHNDGMGHVNDNPTDLLYFGSLARDWKHLTLDPGHDDYYLTGRAYLVNIENSALLDSN